VRSRRRGDRSGASVGDAGDINGDGLNDLIIGAFKYDEENSGDHYVVFGASGLGMQGAVELSELDGSNGIVIQLVDQTEGGTISIDVDAVGDVNGDGVDDLTIFDPTANAGAGQRTVVFGSGGLGMEGSIQVSDLDGSNGFVVSFTDNQDGRVSYVDGNADFKMWTRATLFSVAATRAAQAI